MKRLLGLFISFMMAIAFMVPAYAEDNDTINVDVDVTYGQTEARSMLQMINDWRNAGTWYWAENNTDKINTGSLSSLKYDYDLETIAMKRAAQIAAVCAHEQPDGSSIYSIYSNNVRSNGENIAAGQTTAAAAFKSWQEEDCDYNRQGHRRNMLSAVNISCSSSIPKTFTSIGIGHAIVNGVHYWVQEFNIDEPVSAATDADDSTKQVSLAIAKNKITGVIAKAEDNMFTTINYGDSITLPKCRAYLEIEDGFEPLPVSGGEFSWETTNLGTVNDKTLTLNQDIYNKDISLPINVKWKEYTGTSTYNVYVECTHKQKKYVSVDDKKHQQVCAVCGQVFFTASHQFGEAQIIKQATCTEDGIKQYTCQDCGYTKTESIAQTEHNWVTIKGKPATKTSTGLTDGIQEN